MALGIALRLPQTPERLISESDSDLWQRRRLRIPSAAFAGEPGVRDSGRPDPASACSAPRPTVWPVADSATQG